MLQNNTMKQLIPCLYIATAVALPSGIYILDDEPNNQFYNPLTQPHSQLALGVNYHVEW